MNSHIEINVMALSSQASTWITKYLPACGEHANVEKIHGALCSAHDNCEEVVDCLSYPDKETQEFCFGDLSKILINHKTSLIKVEL